MSDVSKTREELIDRARFLAYGLHSSGDSADANLVNCLADALEAKTGIRVDMSSAVGVETQLAARVPVQGEPNEALTADGFAPQKCLGCNRPLKECCLTHKERQDRARAKGYEFVKDDEGEPSEHFHVWSELPCKPGRCRVGEPNDEMVLAALNAYEPRAATPNIDNWGEESFARMRRVVDAVAVVPDATPTLCAECNETEVLGKQEHRVVCMDCAYEMGRCATVPNAATELLNAHKCHDSAERAYERTIRAEAERDAALAAIERVRAWVAENSVFLPRPMAWEVERALDGAPEPELEYTDSEGDPGPHHLTRFSTDPGTLARRNENRQRMGHEALPIYRRRKAGPWERVEGSRP